uniref:von Hippel-Lindau disease tumour suppressor beta domain-containing protein n=1 Tax=Tetradesmus obliquus TaxID=3088 RepID=A0A383VWG0_TETOB|eukprot:jgi/Sobl393_1/9422/SZX69104.1
MLVAIAGALATPLKFRRKQKHRHHKSTWNDKRSKPAKLRVYNDCDFQISVYWVNYEGTLQQFGTVRPGRVHVLSTFNTHPWRFKPSDGSAKPVWSYMGSSAVLRLQPGGKLQVKRLAAAAEHQQQAEEDDSSWAKPEWGQYRQRGSVAGMPIMAYDCVCDEAVSALACSITHMTACTRPDIMQRLVAAGCRLAIIGKCQVTSDIPCHRFLRFQAEEGGRDIDATTRGMGATCSVPTASCGEENLTMTGDNRYAGESILVHEFAHCVMNLGFSAEDTAAVHSLFEQAQHQKLYDPECYMMDNADEYFAEASQAWFGATVRCDVNSGINTRQKLQQHDPGLAELLLKVYGNNCWCYTDTSPGVFTGQPPRAGVGSSDSSGTLQQQLAGCAAAALQPAAGGVLPRAMLGHGSPHAVLN